MFSPLLCYGEISWDIATQVDRLPNGESDSQALSSSEGPGGCAFNTAAALSALRNPVYLSGNQFGEDHAGEKLFNSLKDFTTLKTYHLAHATHSTAQCQIFIESKTGHRSFVLSHKYIQTENEPAIERTKHLLNSGQIRYGFLQCYLRPSIIKILSGIRTSTKLMTQDLLPNDDMLTSFDLIQISYPAPTNEVSYEDCFAYSLPYFKNGAKQIVLTCGPIGVFFCSRTAFSGSIRKSLDQHTFLYCCFQQQRIQVSAVDTTGCGDAFRAGLLFSLNQDKSIQESISFGQTVGAWKALVRGSCLPFNFVLPTNPLLSGTE
jgi:sugar/nucleoside kinase (ribokinase family)